MKDIFNKKTTRTYLTITAFFVPVIFLILSTIKLDNDIWYLLAEGRYIVNNGIYHIDPLSIHENFQVIVQNWAGASLYYLIYKYLGFKGIFFTVIFCNFIICLLLYRICMLISNNRKILSLVIMLATDMAMLNYYIVSRPQIFSFILILLTIYLLEKFIKEKNNKYLIGIPILTFLEINIHASLWLMMMAYIFCYLLDSLNIKFLHTENYSTKPLIVTYIISILTSLINPYGIKDIAFIFKSYGAMVGINYVSELSPFEANIIICNISFYIILLSIFIFAVFRKGNVRLRYICMFCGSLLIGLNSIKGLNLFLLISLIPFTYFFKDILPKENKLINKFILAISIVSLIIMTLSITVTICSLLTGDFSKLGYNDAKRCLDNVGDKVAKENVKFYASYNDGGYVEFRGYKSYLDPRGEVFLKKNNNKYDVLKEKISIENNSNLIKKFLKKYNFTHILVDPGDMIYAYLKNKDSNYLLIYEDSKNKYRLYARKDLYNQKEIKYFESLYKNKGDKNEKK